MDERSGDGDTREGSTFAIVAAIWVLALIPNNSAGSRAFTVAVSAVAALLLREALRRRKSLVVTMPVALVGVVYLSMLLSTIRSDASELLGVIRFGCLMVLLGLAAAQLRPDQHPKVMRGILALACLEAALAIGQRLGVAPATWGWVGQIGTSTFGVNPIWTNGGRAPGTLGHGIVLGVLLAVGILIALTSPGRTSVPLRFAVAILLGLGIAASGSRSVVIVGAAVLLFTIYTQRATPISTAEAKIFGAFALVLSFFFVDYRSLTLVESLNGSTSLTNRIGSWDVFGGLIRRLPLINNLFGNGWGSLPDLGRRGFLANGGQLAIDNNFVSLYALGGWVSLIAMLVLMGRGLRKAPPTGRVVLILLLGMFLAFDIVAWALPSALIVVFACLPHTPVRDTSPKVARSDLAASR